MSATFTLYMPNEEGGMKLVLDTVDHIVIDKYLGIRGDSGVCRYEVIRKLGGYCLSHRQHPRTVSACIERLQREIKDDGVKIERLSKIRAENILMLERFELTANQRERIR